MFNSYYKNKLKKFLKETYGITIHSFRVTSKKDEEITYSLSGRSKNYSSVELFISLFNDSCTSLNYNRYHIYLNDPYIFIDSYTSFIVNNHPLFRQMEEINSIFKAYFKSSWFHVNPSICIYEGFIDKNFVVNSSFHYLNLEYSITDYKKYSGYDVTTIIANVVISPDFVMYDSFKEGSIYKKETVHFPNNQESFDLIKADIMRLNLFFYEDREDNILKHENLEVIKSMNHDEILDYHNQHILIKDMINI